MTKKKFETKVNLEHFGFSIFLNYHLNGVFVDLNDGHFKTQAKWTKKKINNFWVLDQHYLLSRTWVSSHVISLNVTIVYDSKSKYPINMHKWSKQ